MIQLSSATEWLSNTRSGLLRSFIASSPVRPLLNFHFYFWIEIKIKIKIKIKIPPRARILSFAVIELIWVNESELNGIIVFDLRDIVL